MARVVMDDFSRFLPDGEVDPNGEVQRLLEVLQRLTGVNGPGVVGFSLDQPRHWDRVRDEFNANPHQVNNRPVRELRELHNGMLSSQGTGEGGQLTHHQTEFRRVRDRCDSLRAGTDTNTASDTTDKSFKGAWTPDEHSMLFQCFKRHQPRSFADMANWGKVVHDYNDWVDAKRKRALSTMQRRVRDARDFNAIEVSIGKAKRKCDEEIKSKQGVPISAVSDMAKVTTQPAS